MQVQVSTNRPLAATDRVFGRIGVAPADADGFDALHVIGIRCSVARGPRILGNGGAAHHWFKLVAGTACAIKHLPDGRRHIAAFLQPGDDFGFEARGEYHFAAEALTDLELIRYPTAAAEALTRTER